jgi:hypothetical protein
MKRWFDNRFIRRDGSSQYLLLLLTSFALSVLLTRGFLEWAGYPQIGNSELHIAHVLWGGLLLFIAALLPILFSNRNIYWIIALLAGLGMGLFIDEVGKFITQTNDYFYPLAAPIIYAFFLLTVLLYFTARRSKLTSSKAMLYSVLELMKEAINNDLDEVEAQRLNQRLQAVIEMDANPNHRKLAQSLRIFLEMQDEDSVKPRKGLFYSLYEWLQKLSNQWLTETRLKFGIILGLSVIALQSIIQFGFISFISYQLLRDPQTLASLRFDLAIVPSEPRTITWFLIMVLLDGIVGLILAYAVSLLLRKHHLKGARWGMLGLVFSLTTVSLLGFYYNQFATASITLTHLFLLLIVNLYQARIEASAEVLEVNG